MDSEKSDEPRTSGRKRKGEAVGRAEETSAKAAPGKAGPAPETAMGLEELQHWTWVIGRAQQMMMEFAEQAKAAASEPQQIKPLYDPIAFMEAAGDFWSGTIDLWSRMMAPDKAKEAAPAKPDRRFQAAAWTENPVFDMIRQSYLLISDHMLKTVETIEGIDAKQKEQLRFLTRGIVDAMSPTNFPFTNPQVLEKTIETGGTNLLKGLEHMLADLQKGQLTHTDNSAFEVGRNIAVTPGKVIHETPLYQLIQYSPTTETVLKTPLIIFPPWINRFYILDLNPKKSFIRWCVEQGLTVFMVSWKSADESMKDIGWDDYILKGQIDAIDTVRDLLDVEKVHTIGYCVAGTTLAATLAILHARGEQEKVASATFFTAQVDFSQSGELGLFVDDEQLKLLQQLSQAGYLDGRYMAATFNLLRGRDLIWNYVVNNYLLGQDYPPFDLLHWNGDTTNLPAKWHQSYLTDLYRDNLLVKPGALRVGDVPIDLGLVRTPVYIQAGREDHIAPPESVWKLTEHFLGDKRFVLAGSGHIAGVVNPPEANKYQYWTAAEPAENLDAFVAAAQETPGSWWPDWIGWLRGIDAEEAPVEGGRRPGEGKKPAIEDAPGRYVKAR